MRGNLCSDNARGLAHFFAPILASIPLYCSGSKKRCLSPVSPESCYNPALWMKRERNREVRGRREFRMVIRR